jgi:tetratricopeptide (TPR) repeat protein
MNKENYSEALSKLEKLQQSVKSRPYEKSLVLQTFGYLYSAQNQADKAITAFRQSLEPGAMPDQASQNIKLNIVQLYMELNKNNDALEMYKQWLKKETKPSPAALIMGGTLYTSIKDYDNAELFVKKALKQAKNPRETWYQLLLAIYYETKKYRESAQLLEKMLVKFPDKKNYWLSLSGIYFTLHKDKQALSVSQLAYSKGLLDSEAEILNLARLYRYMNLPHQAAKLIKNNMTNKIVSENKNNLILLSDSYLQARETSSASSYLDKAAKISNDPELFLRLANIHASLENWSDVVKTLESLNIAALKSPGKAHLLKGIAYYEQHNQNEAIKSFKKASLDERSQNNAQQWLNLVSSQHDIH